MFLASGPSLRPFVFLIKFIWCILKIKIVEHFVAKKIWKITYGLEMILKSWFGEKCQKNSFASWWPKYVTHKKSASYKASSGFQCKWSQFFHFQSGNLSTYNAQSCVYVLTRSACMPVGACPQTLLINPWGFGKTRQTFKHTTAEFK